MLSVKYAVLAVLLGTAFYHDVRTSKIPNCVTVSGLLAGILISTEAGGIPGLLYALESAFVTFVLLYIMYRLGGLGAGDVKLFTAIGAITGLEYTMYTLLYAAGYGIIIGLGIALSRGELFIRIKNLFFNLVNFLFFRYKKVFVNYKNETGLRFPFMYAVLPGAVTAYFYIPVYSLF